MKFVEKILCFLYLNGDKQIIVLSSLNTWSNLTIHQTNRKNVAKFGPGRKLLAFGLGELENGFLTCRMWET